MEKTLRMSLLFDFYGPLLTDRQQEVYQMYFHEDLSLGEIGEQLGVSRQAVYDILRRSAAIVEDYESKLALVTKHQQRSQQLAELQEMLDKVRDAAHLGLDNPQSHAMLGALQEKLWQIVTES